MSTTSSETPLVDLTEDMDTDTMDHEQDAASFLHEYQSHLLSVIKKAPGPTFESLPREIRDKIYGGVLLVNFEIEPYEPAFAAMNSDDDDSDVSELTLHNLPALLLVNKTIGAEARSMLYSKNNWRVPNWGAVENATVFHTYPNHFHHITMAFHQLDLPGSVVARISKLQHSFNSTRGDGVRARAVHSSIVHEAGKLWQKSWTLLSWYISNMKQLKTITIDIEDFACPGGCCRLRLFRRAAAFHQNFLSGLRPKTLPKYAEKGRLMPNIFIRGILNDEERKLICEDFILVEAPRMEDSIEL